MAVGRRAAHRRRAHRLRSGCRLRRGAPAPRHVARRLPRRRYRAARAGAPRAGGSGRGRVGPGRPESLPRRGSRRPHRRDLLRAAEQVRDETRRVGARGRAAPFRRLSRGDRLFLRVQHARVAVDRPRVVPCAAEGRRVLPVARADRRRHAADPRVAARQRRRGPARGRGSVQPARRRGRHLRARGDRHHRAGRARAERRRDRRPGPVSGRHAVHQGARRRIRCGRHDVPRPGPDRDQAAGLLQAA